MDTITPERLLRLSEVATVLGLSRSKVYELAARRALPTVRIGRAVRVPAVALQNWIERLAEEGEDNG